ncbi:MAG: type II toxin-antitoxin system VapC family toxin [Gemmatimonadota bacterium]
MATAFLDTNVFLYAAGQAHPEREPCRRLLEAVAEGEILATTSIEVVREILYVLARRDETARGVALARGVLRLLPGLLPVTPAEIAVACDLLAKHPGLPARDAVHAATMRNRGLELLVSADPHFDAIAWIQRLDPASAG